MTTISDDQLADANLTRAILKTVMREINGSEKEAFNHWNMVSEYLRNLYRKAAV